MVLAAKLPEMWKRIEGKIDPRRFAHTLKMLEEFVEDAEDERDDTWKAFGKVTRTRGAEVTAALSAANLAKVNVYNVLHYGARADGVTNDAPAINRAIDACNAGGGGTVFVPSGAYATGSVHLKSNVTLALDKGAVLKAMPAIMDPWEPNPNDKGVSDPAPYHWEASLIWGKNLENVSVYGPGTLDGSALTRSSTVPKGTGDKGIALKQCKNVRIRNLNIRGGGHYAILATDCDDLLIDNVTVKTGRKGLVLSQCRNVEVANCHIDAVRYRDGTAVGGEDAITLDVDLPLGKTRPSENISVRNSYLASGSNAHQPGSETTAPIRFIRFDNVRILRGGKATNPPARQ